MVSKHLSYLKAGVSTSRGDRFVDAILPFAKATHRKEVMSSVGGFAAIGRIPSGIRKPRLVLSTDGVGTKVLLAKEMKKFDTVGIDLVAMSVNDILTLGAEPLYFLDYFATSKLDIASGKSLVSGVAKGCKEAKCALVGGETAEMPQVYRQGDFDLAGFCVGVVDENKIVSGRRVKAQDVILGFPSNGVHSNGFSLVRAILKRAHLSLGSRWRELNNMKLGEALLAPTRIYVREILASLNVANIHAMAHITGSGLEGNVPRAFPKGLGAVLEAKAWEVPSLFELLQRKGSVSRSEMYKTFNMGIGFVVVTSEQDARTILRRHPDTKMIGWVEKNSDPKAFRWAS